MSRKLGSSTTLKVKFLVLAEPIVPMLGPYYDGFGIAAVMKSIDVYEWSCSLLHGIVSYYFIAKISISLT
jgi:hypothetical protein